MICYAVVDHFVYLESIITNEGESDGDIDRRLQLGRLAMTRLTKIWKDKNITTNIKAIIVKTLVFPVALYASETWTLGRRTAIGLMPSKCGVVGNVESPVDDSQN